MMNIKNNITGTTLFATIVCPFQGLTFCPAPSVCISWLCISPTPRRVFFSMGPVLGTPITHATLRTKKMLSVLKVCNGTFKYFPTKLAFFFSSIMRSFSASWAFIVTLPRTIFLIVARPRFKFLSANQTGNSKKFYIPPSSLKITGCRAIFLLTSLAAFWVKILTTHHTLNKNSLIFHNLIITTNTSLSSIDEDYYKAAVERFDRHKQQQVLEFG